MNQHLKTAVVKRARSLYTSAPTLPTLPVVFEYSPRPPPRKAQEQPSGSPALTSSYASPLVAHAPWMPSSAPSYSIPPPLWLCPPLDAAWFPLALGIDVGPGPWDVLKAPPPAVKEKETEETTVPWTFECGAYGIPKRAKRRPSADDLPLSVQVGEDSYFVRPDALGVADGVGGWAHHHLQADSARFARMLMHNCASEIAHPSKPSDAYPSPPLTPRDSCPADVDQLATALESVSLDPSPKEILHVAYERTVATFRATGTAGSSTALVALLRDGELSVAHLGDCMLAVVRDGKFVVRSEDMQHSSIHPQSKPSSSASHFHGPGPYHIYRASSIQIGTDLPQFNFPYQLGPHSSTTPRSDAQLIREKVVPGDIVILASDGLGDNLWDEEVLAEVQRFVGEQPRGQDVPLEGKASEGNASGRLGNPQALGEALARRAKLAAEGSRDVPFGVRGRAAGIQFVGGKTDDISVVVAVVRGPAQS